MKGWRQKPRVLTRKYRLACREAHNVIIKGCKAYANNYCKLHHMPMSRRKRRIHIGVSLEYDNWEMKMNDQLRARTVSLEEIQVVNDRMVIEISYK